MPAGLITWFTVTLPPEDITVLSKLVLSTSTMVERAGTVTVLPVVPRDVRPAVEPSAIIVHCEGSVFDDMSVTC